MCVCVRVCVCVLVPAVHVFVRMCVLILVLVHVLHVLVHVCMPVSVHVFVLVHVYVPVCMTFPLFSWLEITLAVDKMMGAVLVIQHIVNTVTCQEN